MGSSDGSLRAELAAFQGSSRMARSLALPASCKSFQDRAAAVIGLFLSWVFSEGARALEAGELWSGLVSAREHERVTAPAIFALDGEVFDAGVARKGLTPELAQLYFVRRGDAFLLGAWWRIAWDMACGAVQRRFGLERRCCRGATAKDLCAFIYIQLFA